MTTQQDDNYKLHLATWLKIHYNLEIAAYNTPNQIVVTGLVDDITRFAKEFNDKTQ